MKTFEEVKKDLKKGLLCRLPDWDAGYYICVDSDGSLVDLVGESPDFYLSDFYSNKWIVFNHDQLLTALKAIDEMKKAIKIEGRNLDPSSEKAIFNAALAELLN